MLMWASLYTPERRDSWMQLVRREDWQIEPCYARQLLLRVGSEALGDYWIQRSKWSRWHGLLLAFGAIETRRMQLTASRYGTAGQ